MDLDTNDEYRKEVYKSTKKFIKNNFFDNLILAHFKEYKSWAKLNIKTEENSTDSRKNDFEFVLSHNNKIKGLQQFIKHGGHRNFNANHDSTMKHSTRVK